MKINEILVEAPAVDAATLRARQARTAAFNQSRQAQTAQPTTTAATTPVQPTTTAATTPVQPTTTPVQPTTTPVQPTTPASSGELDTAIAQVNGEQPMGVRDRFNATAQRGADAATKRKETSYIGRAMGTSGSGIAGGIRALTNTIKNAPNGIPSSYAVLPGEKQQPVAGGPGAPIAATNASGVPMVAPQNAEYLRTLAKNKVATKPTGTPEVDAVLRSAGLLKP